MTFHSDESKTYPEINSRANLFYFLQNMSGLAEIEERESHVESAFSTDQLDDRPSHSGQAP